MVKTRRSNGENGEVDDGNYAMNDESIVSEEKVTLYKPLVCCAVVWYRGFVPHFVLPVLVPVGT